MSAHHEHHAPQPDERRDLGEALERAERALVMGSIPPFEGPPPEVQREIAAAQRAWRSLAAQGREVRFEAHADGHVSIELTDRAGHPLDEIGPLGLFRLLKLQG